MYQDFYNPYYQPPQNFYQQQQPQFQNRDISQFVTVNNENEIGSRLMPRDGTPVFYRVKDTQDVFECAFINGQTCITAYSLVPKIQKQAQPQQQQNNNIPNNNSSLDELNRRLTHVEKYLQDLTSGGSNNASVYPSNPATATATEPVRTVTPAAIS
jgi:hypothetical protein